MSNPYINQQDFLSLADVRDMLQLSGDANSSAGVPGNIDFILDMNASELDSYLSGRYVLPLTDPPAICAKFVATRTKVALFGRRSTLPPGLKAEMEWADKWIEGIMDGRFSLPGIARANGPAVAASDSMDGTSRFDRVFGQYPSPTGPSGSL